MTPWGVERRRAPRLEPAKAHTVSVDASATVHVLDFSRSGVLLASKLDMHEGERADVIAVTPTGSIRVPVEVRHVTSRFIPRVGQRFCAGARFLELGSAAPERFYAMLRTERS